MVDSNNEALGQATYRWKKIITEEDLIDIVYPVGSIYMSVNSTSPSTLFGGTWEQIEDKFLLASGTSYANGSTGGEATHTLSKDEMPSHTHTQNSHTHGTGNSTYNKFMATNKNIEISNYRKNTVNGSDGYIVFTDESGGEIGEYTATGGTTATNQNTGGGQAHNNMPPYLAVNVWKRTA